MSAVAAAAGAGAAAAGAVWSVAATAGPAVVGAVPAIAVGNEAGSEEVQEILKMHFKSRLASPVASPR